MKLTSFGKAIRQLRLTYEVSLKDMAAALDMSSSHLSGIEYGDKKLSDKHLAVAVEFFRSKGATAQELAGLRTAASESMTAVNTERLSSDARTLVAAFARALQSGKEPAPEVRQFLKSHF